MSVDFTNWEHCHFWLRQARKMSMPFSTSSAVQRTRRMEKLLEALTNADMYRRLAKAAANNPESPDGAEG